MGMGGGSWQFFFCARIFKQSRLTSIHSRLLCLFYLAVIFRTKFVDGSSTVSRTANATAVAAAFAKDEARTKALQAKGGKTAEEENEGGKSSKGRKGPAKKRGKASSDRGGVEVEA